MSAFASCRKLLSWWKWKAEVGPRQTRSIAYSKQNSATNSKERVAMDNSADASNLSTRGSQQSPGSLLRMAITSVRRSLMISAGHTGKGSTPSMAFRLGQQLGIGSATYALNISTRHQLQHSPIARDNS